MATPVLRRGEAVVWLPPRADGERAFGTEARLLATVSDGAGSLRYARVSLDGMPPARSVRLVFDPRDVTLIPATVPALSGSRLAQALPNIVEDSLLQDPSTCAMVAGPRLDDGRRVIGVIDRDWLEFTVGAFERRGMRVRSAVPAQLAVPLQPDQWSLACVHGGLALRTGELEGLGWSAGPDAEFRTEAVVAMLGTSLADVPKPASIAVHAEDTSWREPLERASRRLDIPFTVSGLPLPDAAGVDLLGARAGAGRRMLQSFDLHEPALGVARPRTPGNPRSARAEFSQRLSGRPGGRRSGAADESPGCDAARAQRSGRTGRFRASARAVRAGDRSARE
jgi:general secretion pathway protein L